MNASLISRFQLNTSIQLLVDALFIEQWHFNVSYPSFYEQCAPTYCHYTVNEHNNALHVVSQILGLYGGLTVSLRFIVPLIVELYYILKSV
ncbi:unnamed protein product, partial [Rotaria sp. Silwood1]